jgi:hypothetical protein
MNNSIYKKKSAFKQSLPQYRDGGKKFAAGLAGFTTKIPVIGDMLEQPLSNTKVAKEYKGAFDGGQFVGALAETGANIAVGNVPGAISSGADAMQEGLEMGSSVASNNNNLDRAKRLTTASTAFGALEQGAGMFNTSQFGGGFNPMQMMGDANIPMMMKNGGSLKKYNLPTHEDGGGAIDANGKLVNPNSPLAQAELEKTETLDTKQNYVFSDTLKPMKSKLTFADLSKRIDNKYKDKNDAIATKSKDRELERLAQSNEELRLAKEAKTNPIMKNGGKLPKYFDGGDYNPYGLGSGTVKGFANDHDYNYANQWDMHSTPRALNATYNNQLPEPEEYYKDSYLSRQEWLDGYKSELGNLIEFHAKSNHGNWYNPKPIELPEGFFPREKQELIPSLKRKPAEMKLLDTKLPVTDIGTNYKVKDRNLNTPNQQFTTGDKFQLAGLAPATIYNTIQALRPAEKFNPLTSSLFGSGLNDMNQNVRFNTNPILMNRNVGMNQINQGSTSDSIARANKASLYFNTNRALGELAEKEALANVGIKQDLGRAKIGVGAQDVAAQERARQYNVQARQAKQQFGATAASQLGQGLTEFGKSSNQGLSNRIGYDVLKNISPNFTLAEYNRLVKAGMSDGEIIKFINK